MKIEKPKSKQPILDHAKVVFHGVLFDVYQWEQEMYDGSTATFEKIKRPDTVLVIPITPDHKIIVADQAQPGEEAFVGLPGGRIDEGEEVLDAAKRELLEETGHEAEEWVLWDAVQPVSKIEWAIYTFIARGCKKVSDMQLDAGEKITLKEVSFEEFVDLALQPEFDDKEIQHHFFVAKLDPNKLQEIKKQFGFK